MFSCRAITWIRVVGWRIDADSPRRVPRLSVTWVLMHMVGGAGAAGPAPPPRSFGTNSTSLDLFVNKKCFIRDITRISHKQFHHPRISQVYPISSLPVQVYDGNIPYQFRYIRPAGRPKLRALRPRAAAVAARRRLSQQRCCVGESAAAAAVRLSAAQSRRCARPPQPLTSGFLIAVWLRVIPPDQTP